MIPSETKQARSDEWYTPEWLVTAAYRTMGGIDLDPASNQHGSPNVPAAIHYTERENGLSRDWSGRVFLNPPWSETGRWIAKALREIRDRRATQAVLVLRGLGLETRAYQELLCRAAICVIRGRIAYSAGCGQSNGSPTQGTLVAYLGDDTESFIREFAARGVILLPKTPPPAPELALPLEDA